MVETERAGMRGVGERGSVRGPCVMAFFKWTRRGLLLGKTEGDEAG